MQKLCVHNGHIWERATLHLKSAVQYDHNDIVSQIELDLLRKQIA